MSPNPFCDPKMAQLQAELSKAAQGLANQERFGLPPTFKERLQYRLAEVERQAAQCRNALELLDSNPDAERLITLLLTINII